MGLSPRLTRLGRSLGLGPALLLVACGGGGDAGTATGFRLSGSIRAAATNVADTDVNDPLAPYAANDDFDRALLLPEPALVGGYANMPGAGATGRSFDAGDLEDFYRVDLEAGDQVVLSVAIPLPDDPAGGDLDLYLWDAGRTLVDSAEGMAAGHTVQAPTAGSYYIEVRAAAGASNYGLAVGAGGTAAIPTAAAFVPGEVVVVLTADAAARHADAAAAARALGLEARAGAPDRPMLLALPADAGPLLARAGLDPRAGPQGGLRRPWETLQVIRWLRGRPEVRHAEPNFRRRPLYTPADPSYGLQWHLPLINLPAAWDRELGSPAVVTAVVDTGILHDHPDLQGQIVAGYDFISDAGAARDGNGIDPDPEDPGDLGGIGGTSSFHGTHVAGTVAAASGNNTGVAGVAPRTRIMPVRVLGVGGGTGYDIMQGVLYAAGLANDSGTVPAAPADVINLSLGGLGYSDVEQDVYRQVRGQGVLVVAAAGNDASSDPFYPAAYDDVIGVSAVDAARQPAPYSDFGPFVDVAAPGGDLGADVNADGFGDGVLSTAGDDSGPEIRYGYSFLQGTSMAAPHVAGVLALMRSTWPGLTPAQVDDLLANGEIVDDLGSSGRDDLYGWGLINAWRGVLAAADLAAGGEVQEPPPLLVSTPSVLDFGYNLSGVEFTLSNAGGGAVTGLSLSDDADWLSVTAADVDQEGLGTYLAHADRTGLADGSYTASIRVGSDQYPLEIPVQLEVSATDFPPDSGRLYVLLVDDATGAVVAQTAVEPVDGRYDFVLTDVPAGTYRLWAGSDMNNDFFICDAGESCGAFRTLDSPSPIEVDGDRSGLDFAVTFPAATAAQKLALPPPPRRR